VDLGSLEAIERAIRAGKPGRFVVVVAHMERHVEFFHQVDEEP
jgi:hypothetical protein